MTDALGIAADVRAGRRSARDVAEAALATIAERDGALRSVTRVLTERARVDADAVDARIAAGGDPGPLAGVPYGVKDLFDVAGLPTTAGAAMLADAPPATRDAAGVAAMREAGAVLVATLNMDEFAYGFATINAVHGTTRNPHDVTRLAGGSSGGSAAAVAGGLVPLALGSDTNGSIRVPASLCGLYGLKPAHGSLPMGGVYPFVDSFDDIGPLAATLDDLVAAWRVLGDVPAFEGVPRVAVLGGFFARNIGPDMAAALDALDLPRAELPDVERARSAAYVMTAAEGGARHLPELRRRAMAFDPQTRDRLIAGAATPAALYLAAQAFRQVFRAAADALLSRHDVLIAPATGDVAPRIDDPTVTVDGARVPARAHLGLFTQPISFVGLPVLSVPLRRPGRLPLGLQLIGAPGREGALIAYAASLEQAGIVGASQPPLPPRRKRAKLTGFRRQTGAAGRGFQGKQRRPCPCAV